MARHLPSFDAARCFRSGTAFVAVLVCACSAAGTEEGSASPGRGSPAAFAAQTAPPKPSTVPAAVLARTPVTEMVNGEVIGGVWAVRDTTPSADSARKADPAGHDSTQHHPPGGGSVKRIAGDSARYAARWAARRVPAPAAGSIVPGNRIVAYYGNPLSPKMGILGELPPDQMLARLDQQARAWAEADTTMPVVKALELIGCVAQGQPGKDGKYRLRMDSALIEKVYGWAKQANAKLIIDVQVGQSTPQEEIKYLERFLKRPDVYLAIDPEFDMRASMKPPGTVIGTTDASDVNWAIQYLVDLVKKNNLPPKVLFVHRFTRNMLTHSAKIQPDPLVPVVVVMDGWGAPWLKRATYRQYIMPEPVQYTGFKLFYNNDTKKGDPLMKPLDVLKLFPKPIFIQYQ